MNIFILDYNPIRSAQMLCDKHIVKMPLETAQLLCSVFEPGKAPYSRTHYNHPCAIWARYSRKNYQWLIKYGIAICQEFTFRYGKKHKSEEVIGWCAKNVDKLSFANIKKSHYVQCCPEEFKIGNAEKSYREYYRQAKRKIAVWNRGRAAPDWF